VSAATCGLTEVLDSLWAVTRCIGQFGRSNASAIATRADASNIVEIFRGFMAFLSFSALKKRRYQCAA
jgi:hypothetical protein